MVMLCFTGTRSRRYWRCTSATARLPSERASASSASSLDTSASRAITRFTPRKVQAIGRELRNAQQEVHVGFAVATVATAGACRVEKTPPLVDAQRLRMHAGQLGCHRDDVDGLVRAGSRERHQRASCIAVSLPACRAGCRRRGLAEGLDGLPVRRLVGSVGTWTSTVTSRSPVPRPAWHTPFPDPEGLTASGSGRNLQGDRVAPPGWAPVSRHP